MSIVDFDTNFWDDAYIQSAPPKAKLLHAYLWTNSRKNSICIYEITLKTIMDGTGLTEAEIRECFEHFGDKVRYDYDNSIVMVLNHFRRQFMRTGRVSPKLIQAAEKNLLALPIGHPFIAIFLNYKYYKHLNIPYPYGSDTVSIYRTGGGGGEGKGLEGGAGGESGPDPTKPAETRPGPAIAHDPPERTTYPHAEHVWQTLITGFPARGGKLDDLEESKLLFLTMPDKWPDLLRAKEHYLSSREVGDGVIMYLLNFLRGKYRRFLTPEEPLGGDDEMARSAKEELWRALRNENNKRLPAVSDDAKKLFMTIAQANGWNWHEMQRRAIADERVLDHAAGPAPPGNTKPTRDMKCIAANEN